MSTSILDLPELEQLDARRHLIRIPPELDVPVTPRVQQLVDSAEFQRLRRISQLGLVATVYPSACHTRFEHSLGVYRMALLYLRRLSHEPRFVEHLAAHDAEVFLVSALLHDLGHWPFCHPIEDMRLPGVPQHEMFANSFLLEGELADTLRDEWGIQPREVVMLLSEKPRDKRSQILRSMLSGPIDIDKMDYLSRDSLHAGVPYGRNFDQQRLIGSLCLNEAGNGLAITEKGRTAAEMMVFARYVMFSEVYWHHAVRSATAMLQRAFFLLYPDLDLDSLFRLTEDRLVERLVQAAGNGPAAELLDGIFGPTRQLYKRLDEFSCLQHREIFDQLARRPFPWLVAYAEEFGKLLSRHVGRRIAPHELLIDAPPVKLEVQFDIEVYASKEDRYRPLGDVSPLVQTLARQQFDDFVKRVRILAHPRLVRDLQKVQRVRDTLLEAAANMDG
jgi:HD superfamily phosphohydrolase